MALLDQYMNEVKTVGANDPLKLQAETDESILVKDIFVNGPANNYINVKVGRRSTLALRVAGVLGNHCSFPSSLTNHSHSIRTDHDTQITPDEYPAHIDAFGNVDNTIGLNVDGASADKTLGDAVGFNREGGMDKTLLKMLWEMGIFKGIPVAAGEKLLVQEYGTSTPTGEICVVYERYDPGDITKVMPNGSESKEYMFINYGGCAAAITTPTDTLIASQNIPAEYIDFPFGKVVPARKTMELHGILASPIIDWDSATDYLQTTYLKMFHEIDLLFDKNLKGLLNKGIVPADPSIGQYVGKGISVLGNYSDKDNNKPFMLKPSKVFNPGAELTAYHTTVESTNPGSITQEATDVGFIFSVRGE